MRRELLEYLMCPVCAGGRFSLNVFQHETGEIHSATVVCHQCGCKLQVAGGILNALISPSEMARREARGNRRIASEERGRATDEWLVGLPDTYVEIYPHKRSAWENERLEVETVIEVAGLPAGAAVLDLGAGTTWTTNLLARRGYRCVALDVSSEKFVGLSSSSVFMDRDGTYYERVLADMSLRLPFRDGSFDGAFCFGSVHHSPDVEATFNEIARVLKPGGRLAMVDAARGLLEKVERFGLRERESWGLTEYKYSLHEYEGFARGAGLNLRAFPAPSFFAKMDGLCRGELCLPSKVTFKHRAGKLAARLLWRLPGLKTAVRRWYTALTKTVGTQFLAIAEKGLV